MDFEAQVLENIKYVNQTYSAFAQASYDAFEQIDFAKPSIWSSVIFIIICPVWWNMFARNEHANSSLTKLFGNKDTACSVFSMSVFTLGLVRNYLFIEAIKDQRRGCDALPLLCLPEVVAFGYIIFIIGAVFVGFSMASLGLHGTYLGDYFGILKAERVTGFPFNVVEHPMYYGSTMCFVGTSVWFASPVGLLISGFVLVVYMVAGIGFEEEFTRKIYSAPSKQVGIDQTY